MCVDAYPSIELGVCGYGSEKGTTPLGGGFCEDPRSVWRDTLMISPQFLFWIARNAVE